MCDFTVVTYFTPKFACFASELQRDCDAFGYPFHGEALDAEFDDLIKAFDFKIAYVRRMVQRYGQVLWLDAECRVVKPIPQDWSAPLISTYQTDRSRGFSSGVLMLDDGQQWVIDLWLKYAKKYPQYPDDFVLDFLSRKVPLDFATIPLEFYDRSTSCPVARGLWQNEFTVIQHPTINRWPAPASYRNAFNGKRGRRSAREAISRQRKGIFFRNFASDFAAVEARMRSGTESEFHVSGWVFDAVQQRYAPELYWPSLADDYTSKPRTFAKSKENFNRKTRGRSFRETAMQKMRLDAADAKRFGQTGSMWGFGSVIARKIASVSRRKEKNTVEHETD